MSGCRWGSGSMASLMAGSHDGALGHALSRTSLTEAVIKYRESPPSRPQRRSEEVFQRLSAMPRHCAQTDPLSLACDDLETFDCLSSFRNGRWSNLEASGEARRPASQRSTPGRMFRPTSAPVRAAGNVGGLARGAPSCMTSATRPPRQRPQSAAASKARSRRCERPVVSTSKAGAVPRADATWRHSQSQRAASPLGPAPNISDDEEALCALLQKLMDERGEQASTVMLAALRRLAPREGELSQPSLLSTLGASDALSMQGGRPCDATQNIE